MEIPKQRLNTFPKRVISSGLVALALLSSGCGISKNTPPKKLDISSEKTQRSLKKMFNPALARAGRKASSFARKHPDAVLWYQVTPGQDELSISSADNSHSVDLTIRKGADTKSLRSGDVVAVDIKTTRIERNLPSRRDEFTSSVNIDTSGEGEKPCEKGIEARTEYSHDSRNDREDFSSFTTLDACYALEVGLKADDTISPQDASRDIIHDMNEDLRLVLSEARRG